MEISWKAITGGATEVGATTEGDCPIAGPTHLERKSITPADTERAIGVEAKTEIEMTIRRNKRRTTKRETLMNSLIVIWMIRRRKSQ